MTVTRLRWLGFDLVVLFNFVGTPSASWAMAIPLRRIPMVARTI